MTFAIGDKPPNRELVDPFLDGGFDETVLAGGLDPGTAGLVPPAAANAS